MEGPLRIVGMLWMMALATMVTAQTSFKPVRINCGGSKYTDPDTNIVWKGDSKKYLNGTSGYRFSKCSNRHVTFANTTKSMRTIYCANRFFKQSVGVQSNYYTIPVLDTTASYIVRLHFAEMVSSLKLRRALIDPQTHILRIIIRLSVVPSAECTQNECIDSRNFTFKRF